MLRFVIFVVFIFFSHSNFATTFNWNNGLGGNWSQASNWTPNGVPSIADEVFINIAGTYTVILDVNTNIGTLNVGGAAGAVPTLDTTIKSLAIATSSIFAANASLILSSNLTLGGDLVIDGNLFWTQGTIDGLAHLSLRGSTFISGNASKTIETNVFLLGVATWSNGNINSGLASEWTITMTGILNIDTDSTWSGLGSIINNGIFQKRTGNGLSNIDIIFSNQQTVNSQSGVLQIGRGGFNNGLFDASGGIIRFSGATFHDWSGVIVNGAKTEINGSVRMITASPSSVSVGATLTQNAGTIDGSGVLNVLGHFNWNGGTIEGAGSLNLSGTSTIDTALIKVLDARTINQDGMTTWLAGDIASNNDSNWNISSSGVFDIQGDNTWFSGGHITNDGMIKKTVGTGSTTIDVIINNNGVIDALSGILDFSRGGINVNGAYNSNEGTTRLSGATVHDWNGVSVGGMGTTEITGLVNINGEIASSVIEGATLTHTGTLTANQMFNVDGDFNWHGGVIQSAGIINLNGTSSIGLGVLKSFDGGIINQTGTTTWLAGHIDANNNASWNISSSGVFDVQGNNTWFSGGRITNDGLFKKTLGTRTSLINSTFDNNQTVNTTSGVLNFNRGGVNLNSTYNANGGIIRLSGPMLHNWDGVSIGGTTTTEITGNVDINGALPSSVGVNATLMLNGVIQNSQIFNINGHFNWNGGSLKGNGIINLLGTTTLGGVLKNLDTKTVNQSGNLTWLAGNMNSDNGATWNINIGALFDIQSDASWLNGGRLNNAGTLQKSGAFSSTIIDLPVVNTGTVDSQLNTLSFSNTYTQNSGLTTLSGGNISVSNSLNIVGGILTGNGVITGDVINGGMLEPGNSSGGLTISNHYTQAPSGLLNMEIGGLTPVTLFDQLTVGGMAILNGTLDISLIGEYIPNVGDNFVLLNGPSSGSFVSINFPTAVVGLAFNVSLNPVTMSTTGGMVELSLSKTQNINPILTDRVLIYTLTTTNNSTTTATNVVLTDTLPAGVSFVTASPGCNHVTGVVTCNLGSLVSSAQSIIFIQVMTPGTAGTITNNANVSATEGDSDLANNSATLSTEVQNVNLTIGKTDSKDPVQAGEIYNYTINYANSGTGIAANIIITETYDANITFISATPPPDTGNNQWTFATLAAGQNGIITVTVQANSPLVNNTILTNQVVITSDQGNANSNETTTVNSIPMLLISKSSSPNPVLSGGIVTYTLNYSNHARANAMATHTLVTETYPNNVSFVSATPPPNETTDNQWSIGNLAPGASGQIIIQANIDNGLATGTQLTNQVSIIADQTSANASTITSVTNASPTIVALSISKTDDVDPIAPDQRLTYTIVFSNSSLATAVATNVTIVENYDPNVTFITATPAPDIGNNVWNMGNLVPGDSAMITVQVQVNSSLAGGTLLNNQVQLNADQGAGISNQSTTVSGTAILSIVKTTLTDPVMAGEPLIYRINYANSGNIDATNVTINEVFDSHTSFESATLAPVVGSQNRWDIGTLKAGDNASFDIIVAVKKPLPNGTILNNTITIRSDQDNTTSVLASMVNSSSLLSFSKSDAIDPVNVGDSLVYTLTYGNAENANEKANNLIISENYSEHVTFISANPDPDNGTNNQWTLTDLAPGESGTIDITVEINETGAGLMITNNALLNANGQLFDALEETTINEVIIPEADLTIDKTASPDPLIAGSTVSYVIIVTNQGPDTAEGVIVSDNLPLEVGLISINTNQGSCNNTICSIGDIPAGSQVMIVISADIAFATGNLINSAKVTSSTVDPNVSNNNVTVVTAIESRFNNPPVAFDINIQTPQNTPIAFLLQGSDIDGDVLQFSVASPANGVISGVPPAVVYQPDLGFVGSEIINYDVTDGTETTNANIRIVVTAIFVPPIPEPTIPPIPPVVPPVIAPLEFLLNALPNALENIFYQQDFIVAGGVSPQTLTLTGHLPLGISFSNSQLGGTPLTSGRFVFTLTVTDNSTPPLILQKEYILLIEPSIEFAIVDGIPDGVANLGYEHVLRTKNANGSVTWSADVLIPGLALSNTGILRGIPSEIGIFNFSLNAEDASGQQAILTIPIEIKSIGFIRLTPAILPNVLLGQEVDIPLLFMGDAAPFNFFIVENNTLPADLQIIDNRLRGRANVAGLFSFQLEVSDSASPASMARFDFIIRVLDSTPIPFGAPPILGLTNDLVRHDQANSSPGSDFKDESLENIAIDSFGNRYVTGSFFNGKNYDVQLLKYSIDGILLNQIALDSGSHDYGFGIAINPVSQAVYISGFKWVETDYLATLSCFDSNGDLSWKIDITNHFGVDALYALTADEHGVYAVGESYNGLDFDVLMLKVDVNGNVLWQTTQDIAGNDTAYAVQLNCQPDCSLYVAGSQGEGEALLGWSLRLNTDTGVIDKNIELPSPISSLATLKNGLIAAGNTDTKNWHILRLNNTLEIQWEEIIDISSDDLLRAVETDHEDFIYVTGRIFNGKNNDVFIIVLGQDGNVITQLNFDEGADESGHAISIDREGRLFIAGQKETSNGVEILLFRIQNGKAFEF